MKDDIIRMAREAGFNSHHNPDLYDCMVASNKAIERFAALAAAAKCEELAKKIAEMPFGDTAESFAIWVRNQK